MRKSATSNPTGGRSSGLTLAICSRSCSRPRTDAFLIPAHIWTPWFSMLGSKSGFDSVSDCFGDLRQPHLCGRDRTVVRPGHELEGFLPGRDDAWCPIPTRTHRPTWAARPTCSTPSLSYFAMREALKSGDPRRFSGTIEFYPEQGKYHMDGHRNCGVCLAPRETMARRRPLSSTAANRSPSGFSTGSRSWRIGRPGNCPEKVHPYQNLVPLTDLLAEILQVGPKTQKVSQAYREAVETLGPELGILQELDTETYRSSRNSACWREAVRRMREKRVDISPGFDGEYGRVKLFTAQERAHIQGQRFLFSQPVDAPRAPTDEVADCTPIKGEKPTPTRASTH
ncbi:MAG: endonuclease Q family protein [Desulfobacterales bacterium]|nr:endonuclease Q family protein [Desulfobacterales bacterium]